VLDQNPSYATLFEPDGWTWCLSNPDVRKLLKSIREELCELAGDGKYFHIGFDEAYSHATCDKCRREDPAKIFGDFLNEISRDLKKSGRRAIMWGDALMRAKDYEGQKTTALSREDQRTHEALDTLSKDIIIADWQYRITEGNVPSLEYFQSKGFDVAPAPWHNRDNIETLAKAAVEQKSFGFMQTTWHTLPEVFYMFNQSAQGSWYPYVEKALSDIINTSIAITTMAGFLRKLVPVNGDYMDAGWSAGEVHLNI
jgi:hypothetical protein